jgi:hypothetical protein
MGVQGISWLASRAGYGSFGITREGRVLYDEVFAGLII